MAPTTTKVANDDDEGEYFYYFAYGSNLLSERIKHANPSSEFVDVASLSGYALGFSGFSKRWRGAAATIYPSLEQSVVHGVVWRISVQHSDTLDQQEHGYRRIRVDVQRANKGEMLTCRTYEMLNYTSLCDDLPSPHYKTVIVVGAAEHGLPRQYVERLRALADNGYQGRVGFEFKAISHLNQIN